MVEHEKGQIIQFIEYEYNELLHYLKRDNWTGHDLKGSDLLYRKEIGNYRIYLTILDSEQFVICVGFSICNLSPTNLLSGHHFSMTKDELIQFFKDNYDLDWNNINQFSRDLQFKTRFKSSSSKIFDVCP